MKLIPRFGSNALTDTGESLMSNITFEEWVAELENIATTDLPEDPTCWVEYWKAGQTPVAALEDRENWN